MNRKVAVTIALLVSGCSQSEPAVDAGDDTIAPSPPAASPADLQPLSEADLIRVCRGGASFRNGIPVDVVKAKTSGDNLVRLFYTGDDGKFFAYDCKTEDHVVRFRMIDEAGPGTGPGVWSGRGSRTTYEIFPTEIEFTDDFFDGSVDQGRVKI